MADCVQCGGLLTGRAKKYCGAACQKKQGRADWILKTYGLTMEQWNEIWIEQGKRCGICRRPPRVGETFHLDHEHRTGSAGPVRGILCPYCNTRLVGRLKSAERAHQLAEYLERPPATRALGFEVFAPGRPKKKRQPRKRKT